MSTQEAPPPPPPPIETEFDLWEPVGDPAQLREAARAWDDMAARLEEVRAALDARVSGAQAWSGESKDAFVAYWGDNAAALKDGSEGFSEVAAHLRALADEIESANDVIQSIYVELAATAGVAVLTGLVSFGIGAAAGAARAAMLVARAQQVRAALMVFVNARRVVIATIRGSKIARFAARFARFAAEGVAVQGVVKSVALDQNPFELDNWSGADAGGMVAGGLVLGPAAGALSRGVSRKLTAARPDIVKKRWTPISEPGPLHHRPRWESSFRSSTYDEVELVAPRRFYRSYSDPERKLGPFWTRTRPQGPTQSALDSALLPEWGNEATSVVEVEVPAGRTVFEGPAAPQEGKFGSLIGGGDQTLIPEVDEAWEVRSWDWKK